MPATVPSATRILEVLARSNGCLLEDIVRECPELTWNQVFLELDRLSRRGEVRLRLRGAGQYIVTMAAEEEGLDDKPDAGHRTSALGSVPAVRRAHGSGTS